MPTWQGLKVFKFVCVFVPLMKVASAMKGSNRLRQKICPKLKLSSVGLLQEGDGCADPSPAKTDCEISTFQERCRGIDTLMEQVQHGDVEFAIPDAEWVSRLRVKGQQITYLSPDWLECLN